MSGVSESQLQIMVADYLRVHYPDVLFHSDYGAGIKLTARQAATQKRQQGGVRGHPDLIIYEPTRYFHGLAIELKKDGVRIQKKDGTWANEHIAEQAQYLAFLSERGWSTHFAVGFNEAKRIIDDYLN